jgi:rubredoxin-NAD+ reductase
LNSRPGQFGPHALEHPMTAPLVIVGTGLAGYNLAREWRKLDAYSPLLLITADDGRSYSKPMLSTGFAKQKDADGLAMADAGAMAAQLNAEVITHTRVTAIDTQQRLLWLGGEAVAYHDLVLACGAEPIRVPVEGDAAGLILPVNDLEDYARFCQAAAGKQRVLILGAGLIGCEFANDLSLGGYQVELVAPCAQVMPGLLPEAAAGAVQAGLQGLGVGFHLGPVLSRLQHQGGDLLATLSDGTQLRCDLVLSAVGLRPRTELARQAGLDCARGIRVDRHLRSSAANIFALGDCAEVDGLNLQYVMPLMTCARALAQTLAGKDTAVAYGPMPVTVKTPVCPLVVSPPPAGSQGSWSVGGSGADIRALCRAADGRLLGYALTGAAVQDKLALNRELPPLLA